MASLRPPDLPNEAEFKAELKQELESLKQAGTSRRNRHYYKSARYAGYWPGGPGEPTLIAAASDEYFFGHWITPLGLKRYLEVIEQQPQIGRRFGLGLKSIRLLCQLAKETPGPV